MSSVNNYIKGKYVIEARRITGAASSIKSTPCDYEKLDNLFKSGNEVKMEEIQNLLVPLVKECKVFISYSHKDVAQANEVLLSLNQAGIKEVFLDDMWWGSIDKYLMKYIKNRNIKDYEGVLRASEYFNMILVSSLYEMLKKCKAFIYIKGSDYEEKRVHSPWLYYENKMIKERSLALENNRALFEDSRPNISFPLDLKGFVAKNSVVNLINAIKVDLNNNIY